MILLHERSFYVWTELLRFLLKFVNRNLTHEQGEVFGRRVHLTLVGGVVVHGDVGLVCKLELLLLIYIVDVLVLLYRVFSSSALGLVLVRSFGEDLGL